MSAYLMPLLKLWLVIFMAGNLLGMGLQLDPADARRGLRNVRFVFLTLLWSFVLTPALAFAIANLMPIDAPYALGLSLIGMTPCAPFLPPLASKGGGDLGFTAAFMLLTAAGTVIFMPLAIPFMVTGLSITPWIVAKPLLFVVFLPLLAGITIHHVSPNLANTIEPTIEKLTVVATVAVAFLFVLLYGKSLLSVGGSLAIASQVIFFAILTAMPYWASFGMPHKQRIVLSLGTTTRNVGAAMAPLLSVSAIDQRSVIMVVLAIPLMVLFALLGLRCFGGTVEFASPQSKLN